MVTFASAGPLNGAPAMDSFTGASSTGGGSLTYLSRSARMDASFLPAAASRRAKAARRLLTPHAGSFTRHSATFIAHPQAHGSVRRTVSTASRCGFVTPEKSTPGSASTFFQSASCARHSSATATNKMVRRIILFIVSYHKDHERDHSDSSERRAHLRGLRRQTLGRAGRRAGSDSGNFRRQPAHPRRRRRLREGRLPGHRAGAVRPHREERRYRLRRRRPEARDAVVLKAR